MADAVNAGARLDRLPISSFHYRIFWLVGAGMFFDGYDLYIAGGVLASTVQSKFSTVPENLQFISLTFVGMTLGALITGFVGDRMGRRFTYQINLLIFGLASLAAAFAQDMNQLIACRFVQGLGLGAEIVVGYSTLTEFVPPKTRGRWLSMMAFIVVAGFPVTALLGYFIIPAFGWRPMFVIAGIGSLIVWYLRKNLPESPRWLESQGRAAEAEALMQSIETESAAGGTLPPVVVPAAVPQVAAMDMLKPPLLQRLIVGSWVLITINTLIFGFVIFLPQFFLRQGLTITNSLAYTLVLSIASVAGCAVGAYLSDAIGRRWSIIGASVVTIISGFIYARFHAGADPAVVLSVGFILIVAIYVQTAILFGVYTPELFPTEIRLRANGICNTFGRGATVVSPFIVGALMASYQLPGVVWLMIGLVLVQIVVVWAWGVEPRNRGLEEVATAQG
ncbi:MFS transporter [Afipia sp. GAS231]|uniref:MFS transporter n=1 Tax=Afipia sp. GAS231 TaxID=1882747 RepID=UPI000879C1D1|nr:MFS transporter [Afipia sp. GAS231]SDN82229.1 MFS transporter, putative metabolite:H+ symporter [Afipia sp. GAS231]